MNTLSWVLYAAQVSEDANSLFKLLTVVGAVAWVAFYIFCRVEHAEPLPSKKWWVLIALFAFLGIMLPHRTTLHQIAAVQLADSVSKTQDGRELYDLLSKRIKENLR